MKRAYNKLFVIITGPTAVGKTALVEQLAQEACFKLAVINGDMGQLYTSLSIGTAKPDLANQPVDHYLFNILDKPSNFTAHDYRKAVQIYLEKLWDAQTLPVIVGGSGFYLKSLFFAPRSTELSHNSTQRAQDFSALSTQQLWQCLYTHDPKRAEDIHPHDRYRIMRALTLYTTTGLLPSTLTPVYAPVGQALIIYITRERQDLHPRIDKRVHEMFDAGWLEEVRSLPEGWYNFLQEKKIIGYSEIQEYLIKKEPENSTRLNELRAHIAQRTKAYAKRQQTFWRSFKKQLCQADQKQKMHEIREINLTFENLALYTKQLEQQIRQIYKRALCVQ